MGLCFLKLKRILRKRKPQALLLENVKQLVTHNKGQTFGVIKDRLSDLGYYVHWDILNALNFGIPQKRERVIIVDSRKIILSNFQNKGAETLPFLMF